MRLRSLRDGSKSDAKPKSGDDLSGPAPSQPALGLPGVGSELGAVDDSQREDVVLLDGNDGKKNDQEVKNEDVEKKKEIEEIKKKKEEEELKKKKEEVDLKEKKQDEESKKKKEEEELKKNKEEEEFEIKKEEVGKDEMKKNGNDCPMEIDEGEKDAVQGPAKAVKKPRKRMSAASRMSRSDGRIVRTHNELVEGGDEAAVAFPDDLDFQFESSRCRVQLQSFQIKSRVAEQGLQTFSVRPLVGECYETISR